MVCHDESTKDWLAARVPTLVAWEVSRLMLVGLDALPTYKGWWPGFRALQRMWSGNCCGFTG